MGDQYNWETLLKEVPSQDLHIVSRDRDYASLLNKTRPHPSLEAEWMEKKGASLHIYSELKSFLKRYQESLAQVNIAPPPPPPAPPTVVPAPSPPIDIAAPAIPTAPVPPQMVPAILNPVKEAAIQSLIDSTSFSGTHEYISRLEEFRPLLTRVDAERLIRAAVDNNQIKWIATDSDVYSFFGSLLIEHSDIPGDLFDEAVKVFGLSSEPEDPPTTE